MRRCKESVNREPEEETSRVMKGHSQTENSPTRTTFVPRETTVEIGFRNACVLISRSRLEMCPEKDRLRAHRWTKIGQILSEIKKTREKYERCVKFLSQKKAIGGIQKIVFLLSFR